MKRPREHFRKCRDCGKPMWLSQEGFRCLECRWVFCRGCAPVHFGFQPAKGWRPPAAISVGALRFKVLGGSLLEITRRFVKVGVAVLTAAERSKLKAFLGHWAREIRTKQEKKPCRK